MKKNSYSFREVIVSVWPGYVNLSNDDQKALKEALLAISPDILLADNTELLKAETRRYAIHFSKKFREAEEAEEKAERNALPENVRAKVEKAVERAVRIETEKLQRSYHEAVEKGIASQLSERVEHLEQLREKVLSKEKRYDVMLSGIKPIITKDDYRFLLNTLHSDRVPTPDKMDKAFHIVKKLEPYIEAIPT